MDIRFAGAFNNLKNCLLSSVEDLSVIVTHWVEPAQAEDGVAILLPHSHPTEDRISFSVNLWVYTVKNAPDEIASAQIALMEQIFNAVYGADLKIPPVLRASVTESEYQGPDQETPNTGLIRVLIELIIDYEDDEEG